MCWPHDLSHSLFVVSQYNLCWGGTSILLFCSFKKGGITNGDVIIDILAEFYVVLLFILMNDIGIELIGVLFLFAVLWHCWLGNRKGIHSVRCLF